MMMKETYTQQFDYNDNDGQTGLIFTTNHPNGFTLKGRAKKDSFYHFSDEHVEAIIGRTEVEFGLASEEITQYMLDVLRDILKHKISPWRIASIEPRPNQLRLALDFADDREDFLKGRRGALYEELFDLGYVAIDIKGEDIDADDSALVSSFKFDCPSTLGAQYGLHVHVTHSSRSCPLQDREKAYVTLIDEQRRSEQFFTLRWKGRARQHMTAYIERKSVF